jgi:DNA-binding response OmpR family regulator
MKHVMEEGYPLSFRKSESAELGHHIKHHHSVVLIGMKRVGISNFLRFFLNHEDIIPTYIKNGLKQVFVQVDLNDLVERNISAFWTLLLTRIVDSVQRSDLPESQKKDCRRLFVQSIQLKDQFFTVDSVRKVLTVLHEANFYPTLFLIRFDRLTDVITPEFFSNLLGLRDALKQKMSYVFTSYRPLPDLAPNILQKSHLSTFSKDMYLPPATPKDMQSILSTLLTQYRVTVNDETQQALIVLSGGYVQYSQLAIIRLHEEKNIPARVSDLLALLAKDEQIVFQSEELFESLSKKEKDILIQVKQKIRVTPSQKKSAQYLWNTGILQDKNGKPVVFSPLFDDYIGTVSSEKQNGGEFTKKEHLLFTYLKNHEGELCEREAIIKAVWEEQQDTGISDWAIDRLVARLRSKLKIQGSPYQIVTVVTRGYKLLKS